MPSTGKTHIRKVLHKLRLGDVEDPEIYMGAAWYDFSQTEKGKWIVDNCYDLVYTQHIDHQSWGYAYNISGKITEEKWTYFLLKWGNNEN